MRMQHLFNELETHANATDTDALEFNRFSAVTTLDCAYQRLGMNESLIHCAAFLTWNIVGLVQLALSHIEWNSPHLT